MKVEVTEKEIIVRVPRINPPRESSTGKSYLLGSTGGFKESETLVDGKPVSANVVVMVSK